MIEPDTLGRLQRLRHARDVVSGDTQRPSPARLKSRGIELTIALGRLARDPASAADAVEAALMATLGAANLLRVDLSRAALPAVDHAEVLADPTRTLAGPAGRLADACEKIDHLEEFAVIGRAAVLDLAAWCSATADVRVEEGGDAPRPVIALRRAQAPGGGADVAAA